MRYVVLCAIVLAVMTIGCNDSKAPDNKSAIGTTPTRNPVGGTASTSSIQPIVSSPAASPPK